MVKPADIHMFRTPCGKRGIKCWNTTTDMERWDEKEHGWDGME